ncbi:hypothetical protein BURC_02554 [Burkholderiaceae bacterium]|nr:hypothetical protein BURC_02554 [Burkholderiaceae bacterium]
MTYRSLLVLLDNSATCAARTHVAMRLARERDCHLVGLAPTGLIDIPAATEKTPALANYAALAWGALRDQAEWATDRFRKECRAAGLRSFEAVVDESDKAASVVRHAHCSDLVVMSQAAGDAEHRADQAMLEQVILQSARPTLVVPRANHLPPVGWTALVAWNDSREAARALGDALPILVHSSTVELVQWKDVAAGEDAALRSRLDAAQRWLMWHGVACDVNVEATALPLAGAILSRATDLRADLVVMGAFGRSRWAERVLGGATRSMLTETTLPVLMSH